MDLDLEEIDRDLLFDRILELEAENDLGVEYDSLCWAQDMLYFIDEGFLEATEDGRYFWAENTRCPESL